MSKSAAGKPHSRGRIDVTKTFLPPIEEYQAYVQGIWESAWLTNQGKLLQEFESKIQKLLGVSNFHFVSNGTIALQLALRGLDITDGEVITTPFSYVATTSAILWERCTPVFVDIEPQTFDIDADKIEAAITPNTRAILAVHVFGFPCNVEKIAAIAKKHHQKVIYDAAHAFGVTYKGKSVLRYGDISVCSFHATKLFHTIEGGAVITKDKQVSDHLDLMKRFGHVGDDHYTLGINAKASEFQAAMGLTNLKYFKTIIAERKAVTELYDRVLDERFQRPVVSRDVGRNYAYYPIVFKSEAQLLKAFKKLNTENIFPRRYFYPSLNTLPYVPNAAACPISEDIASRIACLPLFVGLRPDVITEIAEIVNGV